MKSFDVTLVSICILIAFIVISFPSKSSDKYHMELYIRTPENEDIKIRECEGINPDISCGTLYANYYVCFSKGTYYAKAVTYLNDRTLSNTGWVVLPDLCK